MSITNYKSGKNGILKSWLWRVDSERSLEQVIKKASKKAEIYSSTILRWFRQNYATHLLEERINLRYIQELNSHKRSQITEIYTR
ncbi:MAG TPA: tyrosine-type recombinase/integrase [Bacteroidales bacterium]|nr:tyrosine-type recombinase/integrase [Bacteroidales bacterium]